MQAAAHLLILDGSTAYDRELVGGKGASIAAMRAMGLPVPPAFALPIDECRRYHAAGMVLGHEAWEVVLEGLAVIEREAGRRFGDCDAPLLVSVRSGAAVSMPGMMDTILNLGMTDEVERALARASGEERFARNTHVRFIHEFGETVLGANIDPPDEQETAAQARAAVREDTGEEVPQEPLPQLRAAIEAVFSSWVSRRAIAYRKHWGIPEDGGTAVVVQAMVFGNLGERSGTGVLFTRSPISGEREAYGEWLPGGQGEDVVSGGFDPLPLSAMAEQLPEVHAQLIEAGRVLEQAGGDVQDVEFTVQEGRLHLLQTRAAKRSAQAAVRIAADLVGEGLLERRDAVLRVSPEQLASVLAPRVRAEAARSARRLASGAAACPGVACGPIVLDSEAAEAAEQPVILARPTTSPEDLHGMIAAAGIVTERGGSTSHAAVVSRALGRPSVVGVGDGVTAGWEGIEVTVDGSAGVVYEGRLQTEQVALEEVPGLSEIVAWARELGRVALAEHADGVLNLDKLDDLAAEAELDVELLAAQMRGAAAVSGSILTTIEGARAVLRSGVSTVVPLPSQRRAILLLQLLRAQSELEEEDI